MCEKVNMYWYVLPLFCHIIKTKEAGEARMGKRGASLILSFVFCLIYSDSYILYLRYLRFYSMYCTVPYENRLNNDNCTCLDGGHTPCSAATCSGRLDAFLVPFHFPSTSTSSSVSLFYWTIVTLLSKHGTVLPVRYCTALT